MGNSYSSQGPGPKPGAGNNGSMGAPGPGPTVRKTTMDKSAAGNQGSAKGGTPKGMTSNHKGPMR